MQEEERYIQALRQQREKIESLRREMAKKDAALAQISEELQTKQKDRTETQRLSAALQQSQSLLAAKDSELRDLRGSVKRQVQEYETTIAELRQTLMKERNDRKNETKLYDNQLEELHVAAQEQRSKY
jgi:chromosome segregation ATPase